MVRTEPLQAAFTAPDQLILPGVVRINLGHQNNIPADAPDRFTDQFLGASVPVHFSGIDQVHSKLYAKAQ
ncbi:hypothetical protein D3C81_2228210 [compost metagenome]